LSAWSVAAEAEDKACPWKIGKIEVGKWGNGNKKSRIWVHGSFPIPPGVSERPVWFVNGTNVGHSSIFFNARTLSNASHLLKEGTNSIRVQFVKPPYNGASNEKIISSFSWDKVRPGQQKVFK
jgi:hypothetical protein